MKKAISLILALVMCLSLCACGDSKNLEKADATTATNATTTAAMTKDEMINAAAALDCAAILSDYENNPINAKENHTGKVFSFDGYVEEITSTSATIIPMVTPHKYGTASVALYLTLDADDIKKLSTNSVLTFVGQVSDVTGRRGQSWGVGLEMNTGYLIDDTVAFEGKVKRVTTITTIDNVRYPHIELSKTVDGEEMLYGFTFKDNADTTSIAEGDNIVITAQMKFYQYTKCTDLDGYQYHKFDYDIQATSSIEKA